MGVHDRFFKRTFGSPEHAAGEIRAMLPTDLVDEIVLEELALVPGSFVDDELAERHADLLFRTRFRSGEEAYVYVLLEHQSEPDPLMPWRVLVYFVRIWQKLLRDAPETKRLPPIIPLVVHHGEQGWTAPVRFHDLVDGLDAHAFLRAFIPDFTLLIDDLVVRTDAELRARPLAPVARVTLWALRDARRGEALASHAAAWGKELSALASASQAGDFLAFASYIVLVAGRATFEEIRAVLLEEAPNVETTMITAAESFRQEGLEKGKIEGKREAVAQAIDAKFGVSSAQAAARIAAATEEELGRLLKRVIVSGSLDEALSIE
jgi:predicted transposase YdaD